MSSMELAKNSGASINYRWQNTYYWQLFLVKDWLPDQQNLVLRDGIRWDDDR